MNLTSSHSNKSQLSPHHLDGADIQVEKLRLKFPDEPQILFQDLSLSIPRGQKVLILGSSGSGKSTLLQVLSGIIPHSIEIPMKCSHIVKPESWGFVFQDPDTQFCMSYVDEELAFVLENQQVPRQEMDAPMKEVLSQVGLSLDVLHTPIDNLSQGMKQRLALASILLLQPETVFLDEPSALLDPEGTEQIWQSIKQVLKEHTVIVVEHKIDAIVDWIDRVILMDEQGRIIADGKPTYIFEHHKTELIRYGIWYPTVWTDYLQSAGRLQSTKPIDVAMNAKKNGQIQLSPIMELEQFQGFRGKNCKIRIEDATVKRQSWIAITGDNGAGKSTLLLALMQLITTAGKYIVDGHIIPPYLKGKKRRIPEPLSLVFQNPEMQFVTHRLYDELAYTLMREGKPQKEIAEQVRQLLTLFQLELPPDRHPYQLSMGQKRRLSVATVMLSETSVLLLDEPTFGQDARNTFLILEQLERLRASGKTIIMVTHDRQIVQHFATEEWVIQHGQLAEIRTK